MKSKKNATAGGHAQATTRASAEARAEHLARFRALEQARRRAKGKLALPAQREYDLAYYELVAAGLPDTAAGGPEAERSFCAREIKGVDIKTCYLQREHGEFLIAHGRILQSNATGNVLKPLFRAALTWAQKEQVIEWIIGRECAGKTPTREELSAHVKELAAASRATGAAEEQLETQPSQGTDSSSTSLAPPKDALMAGDTSDRPIIGQAPLLPAAAPAPSNPLPIAAPPRSTAAASQRDETTPGPDSLTGFEAPVGVASGSRQVNAAADVNDSAESVVPDQMPVGETARPRLAAVRATEADPPLTTPPVPAAAPPAVEAPRSGEPPLAADPARPAPARRQSTTAQTPAVNRRSRPPASPGTLPPPPPPPLCVAASTLTLAPLVRPVTVLVIAVSLAMFIGTHLRERGERGRPLLPAPQSEEIIEDAGARATVAQDSSFLRKGPGGAERVEVTPPPEPSARQREPARAGGAFVIDVPAVLPPAASPTAPPARQSREPSQSFEALLARRKSPTAVHDADWNYLGELVETEEAPRRAIRVTRNPKTGPAGKRQSDRGSRRRSRRP